MLDAKTITELGFSIVVAGFLLVWLQRLVGQIMAVVEANTVAMTKIRDSLTQQCEELATHDRRVEIIGEKVTRIDGTAQRIERKLDDVLVTRKACVGREVS